MQKNGAGLHTASSCYWDNSTDGSCTVRWENKTMYCIVSVFGLAIWFLTRKIFNIIRISHNSELIVKGKKIKKRNNKTRALISRKWFERLCKYSGAAERVFLKWSSKNFLLLLTKIMKISPFVNLWIQVKLKLQSFTGSAAPAH